MRSKTKPLALLFACGCVANETTPPNDQAALALGAALMRACPLNAPNDASARAQCGDALTELTELRDALADPVLWGGQPTGMPLERVLEDANLTEFNPRVLRRMYLSTFMYEDKQPVVEQAGKYRVLRMPVQFRNMLDPGEYPYPFWHSEKKWRSYETALEVLIFFEGEKIVGAVRSEVTDPNRSHVARVFDGAWTWDNGNEPRNTLYRTMFSTMNPHVVRLESSYRALEDGMRSQNCTSCHDPQNSAMMRHLELLSYPNQALSGRHDIVTQLERNVMPPGVGVGDQVVRLDLIRLARDFAAVGDEALLFEGEPVAAAQ